MSTDLVPLISCTGDDTGGGLFTIVDGRAEQIDALSTTGIAVGDGRLARVLWSDDQGAEILVYDRHGVVRYYRVDEAGEPHDLAWSGEELVLVSTGSNSLLWLDHGGEIVRRWTAPGEGDAWHLNSVLIDGDRLYVCAFGEYKNNRGWDGPQRDGSGFVMDLATGVKVVAGLSAPHHPRLVAEGWVLCNSGRREVVELDPLTGAVRRARTLGGWTRGLALTSESILVGKSASRQDAASGARASLFVLSRESWDVIDEIPFPAREIYDVTLVAPELIDAVRRGFRTNRTRAAEQDQRALFEQAGIAPERLWAVADPLPPSACRIRISGEVPRGMAAGEVAEAELRVENLGGAFLVSAPPNPVHASYRWRDENAETHVPLRTPLPRTLPPGETLELRVRIHAPKEPGTHELRLTLVQELVAWFDDLDPANVLVKEVEIT